jgi:hypothetical protein
MTDLKDFVIAAHGGLERWNAFSGLTAHLDTGGVLWPLKGQEGFADVNVRVALHRQFTSHFPFPEPGTRTAFTGDRVAVETDGGEVVEERESPRDAFAGHSVETPWDRLHIAYFGGYAMWTYLTAPFSFSMPGFRTEELSPWQENGETWRRLKVEYPDGIATHNKEQTFYFGEDGLLRRHDYAAEVLNAGSAAHYASEYREFDGIMVPTKRRVYGLGEDGNVIPEPVLVSIDLTDVKFEA